MRDSALLLLLASTAMPQREEIKDILDCFAAFGRDDGSIIISFREDPGWHGALDSEPPPLEERLKMIVPREPPRMRELHGPPPRVLGRKDYLRPRFRRY